MSNDTEPPTHLDLFSGIGGFALAAKWVGVHTKAFCEIDPFACKVLNKNFPQIPIHEDIRKLDGNQFRGTDLITGGYPCQPFSLVGKRAGKEDPRHLWPEMLRIIKQARPNWVLCENVVGHISMGLDDVLFDLESEGYAARPFNVPSCAAGGWSERQRVWIVANSNGGAERAKRFGGLQACQIPHRPGLVLPHRERVHNGIPRWVDRCRAVGNAIDPHVAFRFINHMFS